MGALAPFLPLLYPAAGPVLLCYAVRAWGVWAVWGGAWRFLLGLLLATVGLDALLVFRDQLEASPHYAWKWPLLGAVALLVAWVARKEWRGLAPPAPATARARVNRAPTEEQ